MSNNAKEIKFPCRWEFRLIAHAPQVNETRSAVAAIGEAEKVEFEVTAGESSGGGNYAALRVSCMVGSLDQARALAGKLSKADGVKFTL